jgi:DNA-binding MarR family transcriptional regulator
MRSKEAEFEDCRRCRCLALRRASRAVTQHYEACFRGAGLRATQFTVLSALAVAGPVTVSRLARILGMERTTLTRNLRPLEASNWIDVELDEKDQRLRQVTLTPRGLATARAALPAWRKAQVNAGPLLKRLGVGLAAAAGE